MARLTKVNLDERLQRLNKLMETGCLESTVKATNVLPYCELHFPNGSYATIDGDTGQIVNLYSARIDKMATLFSATQEQLEDHYGEIIDNRIADLMERVACEQCECIDCPCNECSCAGIAECLEDEV